MSLETPAFIKTRHLFGTRRLTEVLC